MIEWTPALSTGNELLDEQHKAIFRWLAELDSAAAQERTLFGAYAITRLKNYTRSHFAAEEALLKATGYPGLEEHMAEHETFRARLAELHLKSIGEDISADTVKFLTDWLTNHIARSDMAYAPYLKKPR
ncbi:MAG: bacteriohemerythrin [Rhodocyclales bacterium]|jgi:hemerythrin|nr:bacteriohemerythrin [Rhodocyclales bacterium]